MKDFNIIIVEDVPLELKGTEGIIESDIPEAHVLGTAADELPLEVDAPTATRPCAA